MNMTVARKQKGGYPCVMISHGDYTSFYSVVEKHEYHLSRTPFFGAGYLILASCDGWLLLNKPSGEIAFDDCFLLNTSTSDRIILPKMHLSPYKNNVSITAPPTCPHCAIVIHPAPQHKHMLTFIWRPGYKRWSPSFLKVMTPTTVCNRQIYGILKSKNLTVCDVVDISAREAKLHVTKFEGSIPTPKCYDSYLVESCNCIFLVLILQSEVEEKLQPVYVYKLCKGKNNAKVEWLGVENIGYDRAFFLNRQANMGSFSCSVRNADVKGNTIYFTSDNLEDRNLYTYDMADDRIRIGLRCSKLESPCPVYLVTVQP